MSRYARIKREDASTYSLEDRFSKVSTDNFSKVPDNFDSFQDFEETIPNILKGQEIRNLVDRVANILKMGLPVAVGIGGHVIKTGLGKLIIDMMRKKYIHHVAMNGSCLIHDFEIGYWGSSSEDVAEALSDGSFGFAQETGEFLNTAISCCLNKDIGLGESIGKNG